MRFFESNNTPELRCCGQHYIALLEFFYIIEEEEISRTSTVRLH